MESKQQIVKIQPASSLAIRLADAFTGGNPISAVQVSLQGAIKPPFKKPDGYLIYTDLPEGEYVLRVESDYYLPLSATIQVVGKGTMVTVPVQPCSSYPFPGNSTYIRIKFVDESTRPIEGVQVKAVCGKDDDAFAKLMQDVEKGEQNIHLAEMRGKIYESDIFLIRQRGIMGKHDEYCCIGKEIDGFRVFSLREPLGSAYPRGSLLLPAVHTVSDSAGEVVIPFRKSPSSSFFVILTIDWKDFDLTREVELKESESLYLGQMQLG